MTFGGPNTAPWIFVPLAYFLWVSVFLILKKVLFHSIRRMASRTKTQIDDVFIQAADFPLVLLIFTGGGVVLGKMIPMAGGDNFVIGFKVATIVAIVIFVDRFVSGFITNYSDKVEILKVTSGFAMGLSRVVILGFGGLVFLDSFGISVTPILASLGIGSLAVALALQPTLENFFAGVQLIMDKPIRVGQFVKLESGEEGYVYTIGWRSTRVRLPSYNMVIVPNKVLINSKITNYHPATELAFSMEVGVHYASDLDHVERVTIEVAQQVMREVPGGVQDFVPVFRYNKFSDFSISCTVVLKTQTVADSYLIKHEFIKRLHKRYLEEKIVIPYPVRAINYTQEKAFEKS